jgi:hypothetical protein
MSDFIINNFAFLQCECFLQNFIKYNKDILCRNKNGL